MAVLGPVALAATGRSPFSADGHAAIFETRSRLSPEDRDSSNDLYSAADGGAISLVTTGPTDPSLDGHSIVFPDWLADVSDVPF